MFFALILDGDSSSKHRQSLQAQAIVDIFQFLDFSAKITDGYISHLPRAEGVGPTFCVGLFISPLPECDYHTFFSSCASYYRTPTKKK